MLADPAKAGGFELKVELPGQPHPPQQPQGIVQQVGFADGPQAARRQILQATTGVQQISTGLQQATTAIQQGATGVGVHQGALRMLRAFPSSS